MFKKLNELMKENGYSLIKYDKSIFRYTNDDTPWLALLIDTIFKTIEPLTVNLYTKRMDPRDISLKLCSEIYQILEEENNA